MGFIEPIRFIVGNRDVTQKELGLRITSEGSYKERCSIRQRRETSKSSERPEETEGGRGND